MKKATLFVAIALFSATLVAGAQFVSAEELDGALPATPVAGLTKQENPQPQTRALLTTDANRNIRWQPWEYRSAFSASVLEQIQKSINDGVIKLGVASIYENETLYKAVKEGADKGIPALDDAFRTKKIDLDKMNENKNFKLAVYTYRHNYADTGLFQLYVSGTIEVNNKIPKKEYPFKDIQAIQYEFEDPDSIEGLRASQKITLWRGAVVRVNAEGIVENVAGSIAGVNVGAFDDAGKWVRAEVNKEPFADWELASILKRDAYNPENPDRPPYVHPSDRLDKVEKLANEAGLGVQPGIKPVKGKYQYNGPRSSYRFSRFLLGNGR
jgi:hypothetical protein